LCQVGNGAVLYGVAAIATDDVWAVGYGSPTIFTTEPITYHWDGAVWTQVASPDPPGDFDQLLSVSGVSSDEVWAVGFWANESYAQPLIERWDGSQWTQVTLPLIPGGNTLQDVSARASGDVWAVGGYNSSETRILTVQWNGLIWQPIPAPAPGSQPVLFSVDAVS